VKYEIQNLQNSGVKFEYNAVIGRVQSISELFSEESFDAVYIGVGAGLPVFMNIPGENLQGVYSANEYLTRSNLMKAYLFPKYNTPLLRGKNVAVVGGGNVAMDSARTALRLDADNVYIVYRRAREQMPARAEEMFILSTAARENRCQPVQKKFIMQKKKVFNLTYYPTLLRFLGMSLGELTKLNVRNMN
jgi:glutamate synthase (NADPH/NADH) small chain